MKKKDIGLTPMRQQIVTPEEFIKLYQEKGADMISVKIIPPQQSNRDFGKILIEWKHPVLVSLADFTDSICIK